MILTFVAEGTLSDVEGVPLDVEGVPSDVEGVPPKLLTILLTLFSASSKSLRGCDEGRILSV